jgi:hypothetical protein
MIAIMRIRALLDGALYAAGLLALPKLFFGHCILHFLGINTLLGFDPLHALARTLLG